MNRTSPVAKYQVDSISILIILHLKFPRHGDGVMNESGVPSPNENGTVADRERLEVLHFASADAQRQAIRALLERGMLNFTSNKEEEWLVRTSIARKLRELGVPFEWLTEHT
jgi:hypothetical protein